MAGDWIKIEKSTPTKPEVIAISELLGVSFDHAFGLCFRFWSWCDDHLSDGHARSVTCSAIDTLLGHAGLCAALEKVGWLTVQNDAFAVPNYDRHLSENAKKRALSGRRKQKQRVTQTSRSQRDKSVTREEKRREENISSETTSLQRYSAVFVKPSVEEIRAYCQERKSQVDAQQFFDFYESKGWMVGRNKMRDWKACVRTWEKGGSNVANSRGPVIGAGQRAGAPHLFGGKPGEM